MPILAPSASDVTASVKAGAEVNAAAGGAVAKGGNSAPPRAGGAAAGRAVVTQSKAAQTSTITTSFRNANTSFIPRGPRVWVWSITKYLSVVFPSLVVGSYDGSRIYARRDGPGFLYITTNGGVSWVNNASVGLIGQIAKVSYDGMTVLTVNPGVSILISTNGGFNFTDITPSPNVNKLWRAAALSSDGTKISVSEEDGYIYTAIKSGSTWTWTRRDSVGLRTWRWITGSANGNTLIAGTSTDSYITTDGGATWSGARPLGVASDTGTDIQCSADGTILFARKGGATAVLHKSVNSGATWTTMAPTRIWRGVSMSANGLKMIAVTTNEVWLSETSGTIWTLQPNISLGDTGAIYISGDGNTIAVGGYTLGRVFFAANE